ncbi:hypothetical protein O185_23755 [Photorhabdus temperata J3]|uniref:Uncharacterized protein n=1 Tax=Photorhabdus temperata J3 TaxID=1389415 RepID=U7QW22_PHOTE|nr:hypothetical protein O185_23755 [Photorhabdus temperata J3]
MLITSIFVFLLSRREININITHDIADIMFPFICILELNNGDKDIIKLITKKMALNLLVIIENPRSNIY